MHTRTHAQMYPHTLPNSATHMDNLLLVRTISYWLERCWRANPRNKAAVHLHCGPSFTVISMRSARYVLVSCSVTLPGRVPYGLSLWCMLGPQGKVSRWEPCIVRYNGMHMFPLAKLPAGLWLCVRLISPIQCQSCWVHSCMSVCVVYMINDHFKSTTYCV